MRYAVNSCSFSEFLKIRRLFYARLLVRGYPARFLAQQFADTRYLDRTRVLDSARRRLVDPSPNPARCDTSAPVFLTLHYTPATRGVNLSGILRYRWPTSMGGSFPARPPSVVLMKGKSLYAKIRALQKRAVGPGVNIYSHTNL